MLDTIIKRARKCKTSHEMYAICEEISHEISTHENALSSAEYAWNWNWVESELKDLAVLKYAYKTVMEWADDLDDEECGLQQSWDCHNAQMGDFI